MDIANILQAIKQGMANQGAMNIADNMKNTAFKYNDLADTGELAKHYAGQIGQEGRNLNAFANMPMAIPALGGAMGTGALMAGGAGAGLGLAARYIIKEHLRTKILQEQARQAKMFADSVEKAYQ